MLNYTGVKVTQDRLCVCGGLITTYFGEKHGRPLGSCLQCGLLRVLRVPDDYMDTYTSGGYEMTREIPYRKRYEHDREVAKLRLKKLEAFVPLANSSLLDVGSANGGFVQEATAKGMLARGLEINPIIRAWAASRVGSKFYSSWDEIQWAFDVITYHDVIEHVLDPNAELLRLHDHLKGPSLVVLDTPDAGDESFLQDRLGWKHLKPLEHLFYFSEPTLRALCERNGFDVIHIDRPIPGKLVAYAALKKSA